MLFTHISRHTLLILRLSLYYYINLLLYFSAEGRCIFAGQRVRKDLFLRTYVKSPGNTIPKMPRQADVNKMFATSAFCTNSDMRSGLLVRQHLSNSGTLTVG